MVLSSYLLWLRQVEFVPLSMNGQIQALVQQVHATMSVVYDQSLQSGRQHQQVTTTNHIQSLQQVLLEKRKV